MCRPQHRYQTHLALLHHLCDLHSLRATQMLRQQVEWFYRAQAPAGAYTAILTLHCNERASLRRTLYLIQKRLRKADDTT